MWDMHIHLREVSAYSNIIYKKQGDLLGRPQMP